MPSPGTPSPPSDRPEEFRYWANLDRPWVSRARAASRHLLGFDLAPPDAQVRAFAASYYDADPIAEAFVEEVGVERGPRAARDLLDRALERGDADFEGAPTSLSRLLDDVETEPEWLDWSRVELGARAFRRYGTAVFRFAGAITLQGYRESSVAKPLALTGAYSGASARRRFLETVSFWIDVSEPGGMRPGAPGWRTALRVRMMHVYVRARLLRHPEWDLERWGVPISQGDALLTLMGGSFIPGVAMRAMGYRPSVEEIEAMMHFWRYVGHLMGVRPRWYPTTWREGAQLSFVAMVKASHTAGEDGRRLSQSYASAFAPDPDAPLRRRLGEFWRHGVHRGYTRFFLLGSSHRQAGLPAAGLWALHPLAQLPFIFAAETGRRHIPGLDEVADQVARRARRRWLDRLTKKRPAAFEAVSELTR